MLRRSVPIPPRVVGWLSASEGSIASQRHELSEVNDGVEDISVILHSEEAISVTSLLTDLIM